MRSLVVSSFCLLLGTATLGCHARPGHPLRTGVVPPPRLEAVAATSAEEPEMPVGLEARRALFRGLSDMETPLQALREHADPRAPFPRLVVLPRAERAVLLRYARGSPLGPVRNVSVFGLSGRAPLAPAAMADLIMHDEAEREAMAATTFREVAREIDLPDQQRRRYRVEMLRRGLGPVRYDFRFTTTTERWDLADGSVIMRYDPAGHPDGEGVTLYRGVCWIEPLPSGRGSHVTELVIMGTDLSVPFFLRKPLRQASLGVFQDRVQAIWTRAGWRAKGQDPLLGRRLAPRPAQRDGRRPTTPPAGQ